MNATGLRMTFCPQCKAELRRRLTDGIERLACSSSECDYVYWENPTPVVAALVQHGEHFILARNARWPLGMFSLITGFLEKGESPEHAISRETKEELGIEADGLQFIGHYSLPQFNQLIIAFSVRACGEISPSEEIAELLPLTRTELERFAFGNLELTAQIVGDALALPKSAAQVMLRDKAAQRL